jgi:hypothetical protein
MPSARDGMIDRFAKSERQRLHPSVTRRSNGAVVANAQMAEHQLVTLDVDWN